MTADTRLKPLGHWDRQYTCTGHRNVDCVVAKLSILQNCAIITINTADFSALYRRWLHVSTTSGRYQSVKMRKIKITIEISIKGRPIDV